VDALEQGGQVLVAGPEAAGESGGERRAISAA